MATPRTPNPLIPEDPVTGQQRRVNRRLLAVVFGGLLLVSFFVFLLVLNLRGGPTQQAAPPPVPEEQATGGAPALPRSLQLFGTYAGQAIEQAPAEAQEPPPPPPPPLAPQVQQQQTQQRSPWPPGGMPPPLGAPLGPDALQPPPEGRLAPGQPQRGTVPPQQRRSPPGRPAKPQKWLFATMAKRPPTPFEDEDGSQGQGTQGDRKGVQAQKGGRLIKPAMWEEPEDPTKVFYAADQFIVGQLMHDINSDFPGDVRVLVTEEVQSKFGDGNVLIPQYTKILGYQDGRADFGQARLPIRIRQASFPDGTVLGFENAQAGDEIGANGVPGKVNNHWGKLILGVGLQALLNISSRAAFSSSGSNPYQQNLPQEYAEDFAQGARRPIDRAIQERFLVRPTITAKHGDPVTISLSDNISFMSSPVLVSR